MALTPDPASLNGSVRFRNRGLPTISWSAPWNKNTAETRKVAGSLTARSLDGPQKILPSAGFRANLLAQQMGDAARPIGHRLAGPRPPVADQSNAVNEPAFGHPVGQYRGGIHPVGIVEALQPDLGPLSRGRSCQHGRSAQVMPWTASNSSPCRKQQGGLRYALLRLHVTTAPGLRRNSGLSHRRSAITRRRISAARRTSSKPM
jgi:hypothetical protein